MVLEFLINYELIEIKLDHVLSPSPCPLFSHMYTVVILHLSILTRSANVEFLIAFESTVSQGGGGLLRIYFAHFNSVGARWGFYFVPSLLVVISARGDKTSFTRIVLITVIGLRNSSLILNQLDAKLKPIATWLHAFPLEACSCFCFKFSFVTPTIPQIVIHLASPPPTPPIPLQILHRHCFQRAFNVGLFVPCGIYLCSDKVL